MKKWKKKNSLNKQPLIVEEIDLTENNVNDNLTESLQNLFLDKDFSTPIAIKKENKLITNFKYVAFQNLYGENACYVNVILHLLFNITELSEYLYDLYQIEESKK